MQLTPDEQEMGKSVTKPKIGSVCPMCLGTVIAVNHVHDNPIMTGQLVIYGEAHPRQLVWVRNGETIEFAVSRESSAVQCSPQGKGTEPLFSPPRPERSHPRNRAPK
jgi:hypothetical protein